MDTAPPGGGSPFSVYEVDYAEGGTVRLGFTLTNLGRLPVRVSAVGVDAPTHSGFRLVSTAVRQPEGSGLTFAPFTLGPGAPAHHHDVAVRGVLSARAPGAPAVHHRAGQIGVEFQVLWSHHRVQLPLPYELQVHQGNCPVR